MPSRELQPLLNGVSPNQIRKSLSRLVADGKVAARGATKSKEYCAA
jgi:predicted HTH transcriptional regulator